MADTIFNLSGRAETRKAAAATIRSLSTLPPEAYRMPTARHGFCAAATNERGPFSARAGRRPLCAARLACRSEKTSGPAQTADIGRCLRDFRSGHGDDDQRVSGRSSMRKSRRSTTISCGSSPTPSRSRSSISPHRPTARVFGYFVTEGLRGEADIAVREGRT